MCFFGWRAKKEGLKPKHAEKQAVSPSRLRLQSCMMMGRAGISAHGLFVLDR
jgi:hypothetical protein